MILVTGATGNVGSEVVHALIEAGQQVRALVHHLNQSVLPPGVEGVVGDLNQPETLAAALVGVHGVFLLSGYQNMPGVLAEMRRAGVERVVLLSSGCVVGGSMSNAIARYNILSEAAVRESGVPWTILHPSGFMSNALRWLSQLRAGDVVRAPWGDVRIAAIDPFDIAAVAAVTLTTSGHEGQSYRLTGPESLLPADEVRVLAKVLGRDLRFEGQSDAEARAEMSRTWPAEYIEAFFRFFSEGEYDDSQVLPTVEDLTGRRPRTFEQWALAHAKAFK
ncbi:nucleotide-diphosphate-sugar epimerase [Reticulibacter mediterranei]|uniref:Nucleotide-diphosphate-sugar epimerase n=1 Tax=Reticulibacter mediterranei TaxID=2778369 RepID=A0A8J3NA12_9CHLR|nr:NAD(P)H-binding protein [Reticulibacter mediterranei]GHO99902.1 nucleotide-diphosphate-sugar epimerase [Reticulibacter mediterranei]